MPLRFSADTVHGATTLGTCASAGPAGLARLAELARDEAFRSLRADACLFLDTETTGLAPPRSSSTSSRSRT